MALQNLPTTRGVSFSSRLNVEYAREVADFGDGYSQRVIRGLNPQTEEWAVSWENLSKVEMTVFKNFFEEHQGVTPFYWTSPFDLDEKKWLCHPWDIQMTDVDTFTLSATFKRVYDLTV